jgi:hypothetical protein
MPDLQALMSMVEVLRIGEGLVVAREDLWVLMNWKKSDNAEMA